MFLTSQKFWLDVQNNLHPLKYAISVQKDSTWTQMDSVIRRFRDAPTTLETSAFGAIICIKLIMENARLNVDFFVHETDFFAFCLFFLIS